MSYYDMELNAPSNSMLKHFRISPLAYHWHVTHERDNDTDALRFGRAMHMALLEPEAFARTFVTIQKAPLSSKQKRIDFYASSLGEAATLEGVTEAGDLDADGVRSLVYRELSAAGCTVVTDAELHTLRFQVESLNLPCHRLARGILLAGEPEMELHWRHGALSPKAKIDKFDRSTGLLSDLKSCQDASPSGFRKALWQFGYHFQAAYYARGLLAAGHDPAPMVFVLSEKAAPYHWGVYECDPDDLRRADEQTDRDLDRLEECIATNEWPGLMGSEPETVSMRRSYND